MNMVADRYQFRARIIPEFLTALPLVLLLISHVQSLLVFGFLSVALFFVFFQGHFSSLLGQKLEENLRASQKLQLNSKYLLDLHDACPNHKYISNLEEAAEKANKDLPFLPGNAKEKAKRIDHILSWMKENTRDVEKFPAVFDKLSDYGFYRNMLALRNWALGISLLALLLFVIPKITVQLFPPITVQLCPNMAPAIHRLGNGYEVELFTTWMLLVIGWVIFWTWVISLKALQRANEAYLTTLLSAASSLAIISTTSSQESPQ